MPTIVSVEFGGTGANNVADARAALGVLGNTGGIISGDLTVTGNLEVLGNSTSLNVLDFSQKLY